MGSTREEMLSSVTRVAQVVARRGGPLMARRTLATSSPVKGGGWTYREPVVPAPSSNFTIAWVLLSGVWWWIFHGVLTEPAHILPFWDNYPEPEKWTDEELGIPPDDE